MSRSTAVDRRRFLAGTAGAMGTAVFGRLPLGVLAEQAAPPAAQGWDAGRVRHLLPAANDSRFLIKASFDRPLSAPPVLRVGGAAATARMTDTAGEHWQFQASGLAAGRRYTLSLADAGGAGAVRAVAARHLPGNRRPPGALPAALLHLRGRPRRQLRRHRRAERLPAHRNPQPAVAPGAVVHAGRRRRERRPHVLGPPHLAGRRGRGAQSERAHLELRLLRLAVRGKQRGGHERGAADRAGLRHRLPVDAGLLPAGRPRPLGERRRERRDRQLPDPLVPVAARARDAASLLSGVPSRRPAPRRPPLVPAPATAATCRRASARCATAGWPRCSSTTCAGRSPLAGPTAVFVDRQVERWLADRTRDDEVRHLVHAPSNTPSAGAPGSGGEWYPDILDRGERGADDRCAQALLAGGLAAAARPAGAGHRRPTGARPARRQRRPARHRDGADAPGGNGRPERQPDHGGC